MNPCFTFIRALLSSMNPRGLTLSLFCASWVQIGIALGHFEWSKIIIIVINIFCQSEEITWVRFELNLEVEQLVLLGQQHPPLLVKKLRHVEKQHYSSIIAAAKNNHNYGDA